ncbi:hypothetical protein [Actinoplanes auranticolor]|uniref:Lipoprotein n=1 Tax=Actinoplanes auranticolor TaxID=47988 RepID=A0A919SKC9_9ACTN|nr:hypothetical protein [Actinoplanes auranticolor]GIM72563.1 hypothetical protein Aau02nite_51610 [Actinoplanes auranticolor]
MRNRRPAIAGLALVAALGLTGCGPADGQAQPGGNAPAAAQQADPAAELAAAAQKLGEQSLRFEMEMVGAITASGEADPKAGNARMTMDMGSLGDGNKIELRKVGTDVYLKFGGAVGQMLGGQSSSGKEWMHVDAAKLPAGSSFNVMSPDDPAGTKAMVAAMTRVERTGANGYQGSLDLAKSPTYNKKDALKALGGNTLVPFTAETDAQGRLVELTLDMSGLGASSGAGAVPGGGKVKTTYSDFGTKVSVAAPPAAQVQELPSQLAGMLNN